MIASEKEFDEALEKLGELYEEAKGLVLVATMTTNFGEKTANATRLFEILREMRDLAAVTMQKLHFKFDN